MNVYLIEDDEIYAEFILRSLSKNSKYQVKIFKSAEECLGNGQAVADAYIVDYNLPGKSGIEFYEAIKDKLKENNKLIMMSAIHGAELYQTRSAGLCDQRQHHHRFAHGHPRRQGRRILPVQLGKRSRHGYYECTPNRMLGFTNNCSTNPLSHCVSNK